MYKITKHFNINEVCKSNVAIRNNLYNKLPTEYILNVVDVALNILEPCRDKFKRSITPSSWYRSVQLNKFIGGSTKSQHITGQAVDFEIGGIDNFVLAQFIYDNLEYDQLILEYYKEEDINSGWIHCSYNRKNNRKQVLRFDGKRYLKGLVDDV